jgi:hypothetical protein
MNPILMAWETTEDDVFNVMEKAGAAPTWGAAEEVFTQLNEEDCIRIAKSALHGIYIIDQTRYAYKTLETILREKGIIR